MVGQQFYEVEERLGAGEWRGVAADRSMIEAISRMYDHDKANPFHDVRVVEWPSARIVRKILKGAA